MGTFLSVLPIVVQRFAANARLMAAVLIGAVLAAALMSTTSIYTDAIHELGLSHAIREAGTNQTNLIVRSTTQSSEEMTYRQNRDFIDSAARQAIGPVIRGAPTLVARSATFFPTPPGGTVSEDENRPRSHLQYLTGLESHVKLADGRMPGASVAPGDRAPSIEVALGGETARRLGIKTGDRFDLHPFWRPEAAPVQATVVGIIDPVDLNEPYWMGLDDLFSFVSRWDTLPFFIAEETYFRAVAAYLPTMSSDYWSLYYLNTGRINVANATSVRDSLLGFERQLTSNLVRATMITELPEVIRTFDEKLFFTRIPLLVLVLQVAGIVLYYLFMVSTMLIERQQGEIALLKSRGATTAQVMQIYIIEGLIIFGVALVLGPPLAAGVISFLGQTPAFSGLSEGRNLAVHLSLDAYLWAGAGALLAYLTLLWPAYQATRHTVVQQRTASARPPKEAAFTRYYLDLVLVGVGALLLYQLNRRGGLVTKDVFGEQSVDPILLLTPAFFILTVGIVFLRLFPLALRLLAWAVSRAQGVAVLIGMWQLVRNPVHYSRLVLLLMLATAVGMFAASFGTTVNRSYEDRAAYEAGAPLRIASLRKLDTAGPATAPATLVEQFDANAASAVARFSGSYGPAISRTEVQVLGIDPSTFGSVSYFRGDFSDASLGSILEVLSKDEPAGGELRLPDDARWLGVWFNPTDTRGRVSLDAEVRDATGRYFSYVLGPDAGYELAPGWAFLVTDLSRPVGATANVQYLATPPQAPFALISLSIQFRTRVSALSGAFQLDDLIATPTIPAPLGTARMFADVSRQLPPLPGGQIIADFESSSAWRPVQGLLLDPLNDQASSVSSPGGGSALELAWRPVQGQPSTHGIRPAGDDAPLLAFASEAFLQQAKLSPGDRVSVFVNASFLEFEIAGGFRLFPTLEDPRDEAALVVNGNRIIAAINANPRGPVSYADEVWLKAGPASTALARDAVNTGRISASLFSFEELRDAQQRDPLVAAGWEGILFISFAAILLLSAIGFLIYSYLTAQKRTLEFAVLRTMGFSRSQIATVVGFEQAFVIVLGIAAGTVFGLRLGGLMIRYMGVTETGDEVLPPMLLQVSWLTIGSAWLVLALAFLVTIAIVVLLYSRLQLHRVLRIGEA